MADLGDVNNLRDVHIFDRQWNLHIEIKYTLEQKKVLFDWVINKMVQISNSGIQGLMLVVNDAQKVENYDTTNGQIYADDILAEIVTITMMLKEDQQIDIIKLLSEQMMLMFHTGRCAVGRTARLTMIYLSIENLKVSE